MTYTRSRYLFYAPFLAPNPRTMTLPSNLKLLPHVSKLRRQSRHLPSRKPKPADPPDAVGRRKSARLSLKLTKILPDTLNYPQYSKPSETKTLHDDHPPPGHSPKDISQALKNPSLTNNQLIDICFEEIPSDPTSPPARSHDNHGSHSPLSQEHPSSPSTPLPIIELRTTEVPLRIPNLQSRRHLSPNPPKDNPYHPNHKSTNKTQFPPQSGKGKDTLPGSTPQYPITEVDKDRDQGEVDKLDDKFESIITSTTTTPLPPL